MILRKIDELLAAQVLTHLNKVIKWMAVNYQRCKWKWNTIMGGRVMSLSDNECITCLKFRSIVECTTSFLEFTLLLSFLAEWRRRCGHVGANWRAFHSKLKSLVWRCWSRNHVQVGVIKSIEYSSVNVRLGNKITPVTSVTTHFKFLTVQM